MKLLKVIIETNHPDFILNIQGYKELARNQVPRDYGKDTRDFKFILIFETALL